jgi:hypothetical protein
MAKESVYNSRLRNIQRREKLKVNRLRESQLRIRHARQRRIRSFNGGIPFLKGKPIKPDGRSIYPPTMVGSRVSSINLGTNNVKSRP